MEWLEALRGKVVGLDTTPVIYFIEERPPYAEVVGPFLVHSVDTSLIPFDR